MYTLSDILAVINKSLEIEREKKGIKARGHFSQSAYSFNDNGFFSYHSGTNIINNKKYAKENKMKQNLSNIYHRKKNLLIKTEQNSSMERTHSPQSTDNKVKYIYNSKLSLY